MFRKILFYCGSISDQISQTFISTLWNQRHTNLVPRAFPFEIEKGKALGRRLEIYKYLWSKKKEDISLLLSQSSVHVRGRWAGLPQFNRLARLAEMTLLLVYMSSARPERTQFWREVVCIGKPYWPVGHDYMENFEPSWSGSRLMKVTKFIFLAFIKRTGRSLN